MNLKIAVTVVILIGIFGALWMVGKDTDVMELPVETDTEETGGLEDGEFIEWLGTFYDAPVQNDMKRFDSEELAMSFSYPADHLLFKNDNGAPGTLVLTIGEQTAILEAIARTAPGEGPQAMHFTFYHEPTLKVANIDPEDYLMRWMRENNGPSNYHPEDPTNALASTTVDGTFAFRYHSAMGLYDSNEYVAFIHKEWVVIGSVYDSRNENREEKFDALISSIELR